MNEILLERGRAAASRGEWQQAYDLLVEADTGRSLVGEDLALLAEVAYAAGHLDVTIEIWERAHAESMRAGDRLARAATTKTSASGAVRDLIPVAGKFTVHLLSGVEFGAARDRAFTP